MYEEKKILEKLFKRIYYLGEIAAMSSARASETHIQNDFLNWVIDRNIYDSHIISLYAMDCYELYVSWEETYEPEVD